MSLAVTNSSDCGFTYPAKLTGATPPQRDVDAPRSQYLHGQTLVSECRYNVDTRKEISGFLRMHTGIYDTCQSSKQVRHRYSSSSCCWYLDKRHACWRARGLNTARCRDMRASHSRSTCAWSQVGALGSTVGVYCSRGKSRRDYVCTAVEAARQCTKKMCVA